MERAQYWSGSVVWICWANGVPGHPLNETFLPQICQLSYEPCSFILEAFWDEISTRLCVVDLSSSMAVSKTRILLVMRAAMQCLERA